MMPDREKVIKGLECHAKGARGCLFDCPYGNENGCQLLLCSDALALLKEQEHKDRMYHALEDDWKRLKELLKEQEEREQAICKEICDFIRSACSTDTDDDKDYVCYVIQNCFKHFCAEGERE